jgi:hypothetical protein
MALLLIIKENIMKTKTIKKVLNSKFNDFLKSITDDRVRHLVKNNTIITGGSIVSMLLKEKVNDFDLYFRNRETALAVAQYYVNKFNQRSDIAFDISVKEEKDRILVIIKSVGIASESQQDNYRYFEGYDDSVGEGWTDDALKQIENLDEVDAETLNEDGKYRPVFLSSNAITLSNRVQCIVRFYGEPEEIHKNYDYVHCTCYWKSWDNELVLPSKALEAILTKELRYVGSLYPLCSLIRMRKFIARGWSINAGQILKMAIQLQKFDLNNLEVLQDQMIGVDAAYFQQVLNRLKEHNKDTVDTAYLMTIIDRIF